MDRLDEVYRELRPYAFAIAYRMLGSVSEAEDVVQDAFLRLHRAAPDEVAAPKAYLATVTTRLSIDALRSARARRESYVGPWLPEPLLTDPGAGPADVTETADSLSMAFLVVLERLSPTERAVFLLHDVFGYEYAEVATMVDKTEANCRQLAARARKHVQQDRPRFEASTAARTELASRFFAAAEGGDMDGLVSLLAGDAVFYGDGGEKGSGLPAPVVGRDRVARVVMGLGRRAKALGVTRRPVEINGDPGAMFLDQDGGLISLLSLEIVDGQAQTIRGFVNPDKIAHLGSLSLLGRRATSADWG
jgi:RNA polymerase sigma-70 factor (ECF subfamily)